ncbi:polysaccharide deacetylase family protein [Brevibacillus migulae]|uniref:polysaccharide deacetylase family protein n=1 Tax=Brevibacillus migulae TaxID=1644114 RepID=UPI00106E4EF3|nr:polysaccharide deacetylase family protein [Brevibacillus migulae]
MKKRIPFLATFFLTLVLVVAAGFLLSGKKEQETVNNLQHFSHDGTSISTQKGNESPALEIGKEQLTVNKQTWYRDQVVVLTYHHVDATSKQPFAITPDQFAEHMAFLYKNDLHPITMTEFLRFVDTGVMPTENAVLLTFDDGYESYYKHAYPIMKEYQFPSVNFVITGRLRDTVERKRENMTPPLTFPEIEEMMATGLVEVASHTYSMHEQAVTSEWGQPGPETAPVYLEDVNRLEEEQEYKNRLYVDFMMARVALSDFVHKKIETISFPFGYASEAVVETAKEAGYRYAFSTAHGVVKAGVDPYRIPRYDVGTPDKDGKALRDLFTSVKTNWGSSHVQAN